jgi:hypothetical protein
MKDTLIISLLLLTPCTIVVAGVVRSIYSKTKVKHLYFSAPAYIINSLFFLLAVGISSMGEIWGGPTNFHPYPISKFQSTMEEIYEWKFHLLFNLFFLLYYAFSVFHHALSIKQTPKPNWLLLVTISLSPYFILASNITENLGCGVFIFLFPTAIILSLVYLAKMPTTHSN